MKGSQLSKANSEDLFTKQVAKFNSNNNREDYTNARKETFRPPFDPEGKKYEKERAKEDNFTFARKLEPESNSRILQQKSMENPFKLNLENER